MRSDIIEGAIFPDYELSDHTGKHRKLSELQSQDPMVLTSAVAVTVRKIAVRLKGCCNFIGRWRLAIVEWSRSPPTTSPRRTNIAAE
jgi:hypothetical protein